jgi:hypothetical protein
VIVYAVIASPERGNGDETLDPQWALLSKRHDGAFTCGCGPAHKVTASRTPRSGTGT